MLFAGNMVRQPCFDGMRTAAAAGGDGGSAAGGYRTTGALPSTDAIMTDAFWIGVYPGLTDEMLALRGGAARVRLRGRVMDVAVADDVTEPAPTPGRLETVLENLSYWPAVGGVVRVCRRRREQILYLVVGGWNTLFGYLVWALLQYLLHDYVYYLVILVLAWFPAVAERLHRLPDLRLPQQGERVAGVAALLAGLRGHALHHAGRACRSSCTSCPSASTSRRRSSRRSWSSRAT